MVLNVEMKIGNHSYKSNQVVADSRYDVLLLGIPWQVNNNKNVDYDLRIVNIRDMKLSVDLDAEKYSPKEVTNF